MRFVRLAYASLLVLVLCLAAWPLRAQERAGVTGQVTDSSGAAVAAVDVTLDNESRGLHFTTTTNDQGVYLFLRVPPGSGYSLTFSKDGFHKYTMSDIALGVSTTETRNVALEVGNLTQSIEVRATGEATLNTSDASIGNNIDTDRLRDLPAQIRNSPAALLGLQPGVTPNTAEAEVQVGAVTGSRVDQTNIMLDGLDVNDNSIGQAFSTVGNAPIDSIQEFRTITTNAGADQGRSSGGQILLVTKSGTNDWHGSLREYHRNTVTAANSFFNNKSGLPKPALIRNQFGGNLGGKIIKDKLFFFFDYDGFREASASHNTRTVPLPSLLQGEIGYANDSGGVSYLSASDVAALDPRHVGISPAILDLLRTRYPAPNQAEGGDGINTGGFAFNSPKHSTENDYVARIDYVLGDKHKFFARGNLARGETDDDGNAVLQQFPGDPSPVAADFQHDFTYILGHTWTISATKINQFAFGVANQYLNFPVLFEPTAPSYFTFFNGFVSDPYANFSNAQARRIPTTTFRDDFTYLKGNHTLQFGGTFKPIRDHETQIIDNNTVTLGLGGNVINLDGSSARPADISSDSFALTNYDNIFTGMLGRIGSVFTRFNYTVDGQPLPNLTGSRRTYNYNEFEIYAQDVWRIRPSLTLTYGLRWEYHAVPYEANGFEGLPDQNFDQLFATRVNNAANGVGGLGAEPLISYNLGGKANHAPGYYKPDYNDFDPRVGIAWSPSFSHGFLGSVLGDRKTSIRLGGGIVHDRVLQTLSFVLNEASFIFDSSATLPFGTNGDPDGSLLNDPRFTDFSSLPAAPAPPVITHPSTPFVDSNGIPFGTQTGASFLAMDQNFRTPYEYTASFGIQRELPHGFIVEANYVGRFGRKLLAQGDFAQTLNFKDPQSGQFLKEGFSGLEAQILAGVPGSQITPQPWFENQMNAAIAQNFGQFGINNCADYSSVVLGTAVSCTRLARAATFSLLQVGDVSDTVQQLFAQGFLDYNVGLSAQVPYNSILGNFSSSSYNGLLVTVRKKFSQNLQFDFDYTYSHSIDNQSTNTRQVVGFGGQVCDLTDLRACRGSSDFDARHIISANWIFNLPFGRGHRLGANISRGLDALVGGWEVTGIYTWHTGFPFNLNTGSFPVGFTNDTPPFVVGPRSALAPGIHTTADGTLEYFKNPDAALAALANPTDGGTGNRNAVNGPSYTDVDLGLLKNFSLPWHEGHRLQFRADMFNAFNNVSFAPPVSVLFGPQYGNINGDPSQFGKITGTVNAARVIQFALRYDF